MKVWAICSYTANTIDGRGRPPRIRGGRQRPSSLRWACTCAFSYMILHVLHQNKTLILRRSTYPGYIRLTEWPQREEEKVGSQFQPVSAAIN